MTVDLAPRMDYIIDYISNITQEGQSAFLPQPMPLNYLLPKQGQSFYRYKGSLTEFPCTENVIWTVLTEMIPITLKQLETLSVLKTKNGISLEGNFRDMQSKGNRTVYQRAPQSDNQQTSNSASHHNMILNIILIFIVIKH